MAYDPFGHAEPQLGVVVLCPHCHSRQVRLTLEAPQTPTGLCSRCGARFALYQVERARSSNSPAVATAPDAAPEGFGSRDNNR
jgi:DNA-directed RNA polymerase subunit RPC12/RpoP